MKIHNTISFSIPQERVGGLELSFGARTPTNLKVTINIDCLSECVASRMQINKTIGGILPKTRVMLPLRDT